MKKIYPDKILNIPNTDLFDQKFLFDVLIPDSHPNPPPSKGREREYQESPQPALLTGELRIVDLWEELKKYKNTDISEQVKQKPAMYSNVYAPKDELKIFTEIFDHAIKTHTKTHIIWVTLDAEIKILEEYYESLWFLRTDINCFAPDFSVPLVTVSVKIENLIWKGSDYKRMREKIFFTPPIRESWENKAMFKWINRGVIAGIQMKNFWETETEFLGMCIREEKILPLTLGKVLKYNLEDIGFGGELGELEIVY